VYVIEQQVGVEHVTASVFVIMAVGSDPAHDDRRARIDAAIGSLGMIAYHPLDYRDHADDMSVEDIRAEVRDCVVALADLSLERPSCYYELGVVHGTGLEVAVVAEVGTMIHQTADRWSLSYYDSLDDLESQVQVALRPYAPALTR
jgi:hypothetical protein